MNITSGKIKEGETHASFKIKIPRFTGSGETGARFSAEGKLIGFSLNPVPPIQKLALKLELKHTTPQPFKPLSIKVQ